MDNSSLQEEFQQGIDAAMDPTNAQSIQGGPAVTTMDSRWLHLRCKCKHTFRLGDDVHILSNGEVYHRSALLPCSGGTEIAKVSQKDIGEFLMGLDEAWPSPDNLPVHRLEDGNPLIAPIPPNSRFQRHSCAVCGHTLRIHDLIVVCPCKPESPMCKIAIHRDPVHGLYCWDEWNPGEHQLYCPATSRKL